MKRLTCLFCCMLIVFCVLISPAQGFESLKKHPTWYFGEGLDLGDEFTFDVCDAILKIPESPDHCYTITMRFLALLPTYEGKTWIVAVHLDHKTRIVDMVFQISANSFKIKTDGANIAYADSIERTIGWIRQFSSENSPQVLSVGRSWGVVAGDTNWPTQIMVHGVDYGEFERTEPVYVLGYSLLEENQMQIKDEFPFPLKATIYRPVSSHQNVPLAFTFQMIDYQNHDSMCNYVTASKNSTNSSLTPQMNQPVLLFSDQEETILNQNITDVEEFTVEELLRKRNDNSTVQELLMDAYGKNYEDALRQSIYNFTRFIEMIAQASNTILERQPSQTNASLP